MRPLEDLNFHLTISSDTSLSLSQVSEISLIAGQLYLLSFEHYQAMCEMIKIPWAPITGQEINDEKSRKQNKSLVMFLRTFLTRARQGHQLIDKTHMGRLLCGGLLTQSDFLREESPKMIRAIDKEVEVKAGQDGEVSTDMIRD